MAGSTRELAEFAGITVNTIRHYHRLGLLDEPKRRYNGYKQYGVRISSASCASDGSWT
jgi:DNA-binding transcriptional MerR regulator